MRSYVQWRLTSAELQYVETDLAHSLRLVQAELEDRDVLVGAFVAQHPAAVPTGKMGL